MSSVLRAVGVRGCGRGLTASRFTVLLVMSAGYFLVLLDVTIVNVALPRIGASLQTSVSGLQCVVDGYALALAALMLVGGAVGDLRGHKRVVLAGLAVFGLGSLGCGSATDVWLLVVARAVQGVGAALLLPGTLAIISDTFSEHSVQARAIGIWAGVGSLALPAGPLLGGVLITAFGWRAVFWVNVPIVVAAFVATLATVHESRARQARPLDLRGVVLGIVLLCAITFAFIEAGRSRPSSPVVIAAAAVAIASLPAFVWAEAGRGQQATMPLALFHQRGFPVANGVAATMNLGTLGALFLLTLYLQAVQQRSPIQAGLAIVPLFAPLAILAPVAGRLTSRIGPRLPVAAGLIVAAAPGSRCSTSPAAALTTRGCFPPFFSGGLGWVSSPRLSSLPRSLRFRAIVRGSLRRSTIPPARLAERSASRSPGQSLAGRQTSVDF